MRNTFWLAAGMLLAFVAMEAAAWYVYTKQEYARTRVLEEAEDTAQTAWSNAD